jgi:site-specific DNA-methyltransferase (adenine-specific)
VRDGYPAEKPPEVSQVLVSQSSSPGELVIDPFMGSGSVLVAAAREGRHAMGNDLCEEAVTIAERRLRELGAEPMQAAAAPVASAAPRQLELGVGA